MNIDERRQKIIDSLVNQNSMSVRKIIQSMSESPATIRRDLTFLEKNGFIARTRGYVKYVQPAVVHNMAITDDKVAVARAAAALIPPNTTICLDSGVFTLALAYQLVERSDLTIITNSIPVINVMASTNVHTYVTCGHLESRQECLLGPETEAYVRGMRFPMLFLTTTGVRGTEGLACVTPSQASMKRAFIESSEKVVLLTDASKFRTDSIRVFARFDEIDTVIVDRALDDPELEQHLADVGTNLVVANS